MTDEMDFSADTAAFVSHVNDSWAAIYRGDAKKANVESASADSIVQRLALAGRAEVFLLPLLDHESAAARCAAATWLLKSGSHPKAIGVLTSLQTESVGLISSAAELALMTHRRSN